MFYNSYIQTYIESLREWCRVKLTTVGEACRELLRSIDLEYGGLGHGRAAYRVGPCVVEAV